MLDLQPLTDVRADYNPLLWFCLSLIFATITQDIYQPATTKQEQLRFITSDDLMKPTEAHKKINKWEEDFIDPAEKPDLCCRNNYTTKQTQTTIKIYKLEWSYS